MRIMIVCLSLMVSFNLYGTQFRGGEEIVVTSAEVIEDDLFVGAQRLNIMGKIDGDLIAGGKNINVSGEVCGDMIAGAEIISISGHINDDARLAAREITAMGIVGSDALCFCQSLRLTDQSQIGGDLNVFAGDVELLGSIGGKLSGATGSMTIGGRIDGNIEISTGSLTILPSANILGDLLYTSSKPAQIHEGAEIGGQIVHRVKEQVERDSKVSKFPKLGQMFHRLKWIFKILFLIGSLVVGLVFVAVAPKFSTCTADTIKDSPWKSLGLGLLTLIVIPIAIFIVSLTGVGLPLGLITLAIYLICLYLSSIVFGVFLGKSLFRLFGRDVSRYLALTIGMLILFFLAMIPYLGWVIKFVVLLFGLGAIVLAAHRTRKESKEGAAA